MFPISRLTKLRIDRASGNPAPHKPLLLLLYISMAEEGVLERVIPLSPELAFRFTNLDAIVGWRRRQRLDVRMPFFHLRGDGLLVPLDKRGESAPSRDVVCAVRLAEEFWLALQQPDWREAAKRALLAKYFHPKEQVALAEVFGVNWDATEEENLLVAEDSATCREQGRTTLFRQRVVTAYDFTCALTGHRLVTVDAGSLVDAAHIRPVAEKGANSVANGFALTKNAHWAFDNFLWTVDETRRVVVAIDRFQELLLPEARAFELRAMAGRALFPPRCADNAPDPRFLRWHRERFEKRQPG